MWGWLNRLAPRPPQTVVFNETYRAYDTSDDEIVSAAELTRQVNTSLPGAADTAGRTWRRLRDTLSDIRVPLLARARLMAERQSGLSSYGDAPPLSITLLIDHSGSMEASGRNLALLVAEATGQFAKGLGLPFEVLGFTTREWRGEPVRSAWLKHG